MTLTPCTPHWRPGEVRHAAPAIEVHRGVLYHPLTDRQMDADPLWGVYDAGGALLDAAAYYRGPGATPVGQCAQRDWPSPVAAADEAVLLYGGLIVGHFGHFVLTSLARLWALLPPSVDRGSLRILFHGVGDPDQWWAVPYVAACLGALGLTRANLAWFPGPTRIACLVVPRPAFEEHNFVHAEYIGLVRAIGDRITPRTPARRGPVYLARTRFRPISQGFVNEQDLVDHLSALGVAIVYPEDLTFAEHVDLYQTATVVLGPIGSAFHPAVFARASCPLLMLSPTQIVNPNYGMLDAAGGLQAEYVSVDREALPDQSDERVTHRYVIRDVRALTRDLVERFTRALSTTDLPTAVDRKKALPARGTSDRPKLLA